MPNVIVLQRNVKRGNVREFDDSYNRGFTDIWASEIDADFDTLYAAWNDQIMNTTETVVSPTPPTNPQVGDLWWRNTDGNMFIYYDDGNSQQFVPVSSTADYVGSGLPTGPAGGGLAGTYPNPNIAPGAINDSNITVVSWTKVAGAPTSFPPNGPAGGVLVGNYPNPTGVLWAGVQGAPGSFPPTGPAGGGLSGTYPNPTVVYNNIPGRPTIPTSLPPTGPAAGALIGTYPAPGLAIGSTTSVLQVTPATTPIPLGLTSAGEMLVQEVTWTSKGGRWFALAGVNGHVGCSGTGPATGVTAQMRLDGAAGTLNGSVIAWQSIGSLANSVAGIPSAIVEMPFSVILGGTGSTQVAVRRITISAWINGQLVANPSTDTSWIMICEGT